MSNLNLKSELTVTDIIGHAVIWILLSIVTFGLALFVYPYYLYRFVISRTVAVNSEGKVVGRLECTMDLATMIGKIVIWTLISIVTLGIGYFVFLYKILAHCMNHTRMVSN
ncbi:hypothetical protein WS50_08420 [Burkholderia territorii]|uniref:DUF6693 family protein n=1 Tax=Burkholderia territorii TaxID=1503055 RepID=UPI00075A31D6|nr:DUF6693 family protein [Burkholderia territorii]KUZ01847.1 hypothetical protein WS47_03275 [Burkholderia territorii]KUZ21002.1 hypothetical protein WS50_08420 [Burkholderia territorii]